MFVIIYFHYKYLYENTTNPIKQIIYESLKKSFFDTCILLFKNHEIIIEDSYTILSKIESLYYQKYIDTININHGIIILYRLYYIYKKFSFIIKL